MSANQFENGKKTPSRVVFSLKDLINKNNERAFGETKKELENQNNFEKFKEKHLESLTALKNLSDFDIKNKFPELYHGVEQINKPESDYSKFLEELKNNIAEIIKSQNEIIFESIEKALQEKEKQKQKEIIQEAIKQSEEQKRDNNIVKVFRFMPFLWSKNDPKEQDRLRETIKEMKEEGSLKLYWKDEINLTSVIKNQQFDYENNLNQEKTNERKGKKVAELRY